MTDETPTETCARVAHVVRKRKSTGQPQYVYFIQAKTLGLIKIGHAWDPLERLSRLQIGSPDELTLLAVLPTSNGRSGESVEHHRFSTCRAHGEWFRPEPHLLAYIRQNASDFAELVNREGVDKFRSVFSTVGGVTA